MGLMSGVIVVILILLFSSLPLWPHSQDWGYGPCGSVVVIGSLLLLDWLK